MKTQLFSAAAVAVLTLSALTLGGVSAVAAAEPTPGGVVIAQGTSAQVKEIQLSAAPTKPGQITASTQPGAQVNLLAKGFRQSKKANSAGTAVFTKLTAGATYTLASRGQSTKVTALNTVAPTTDLTVFTTTLADSVALNWKHVNTKATGGSNLKYRIAATPEKTNTSTTSPEIIRTETIRTETTSTATIVSGINPDLLYTFTVTPVNAMGPGESTTAAMSVTLRSLMSGKDQALTLQKVLETPAVKLTPAPAPAPTPGTRTIYVCPSGFTETGSNCTKSLPYSYHTEVTNQAYTYHTETIGPMPIIDSYETQSVCPSGYNLEDYGVNGKWCRLYGPAPTAQVKDAAPAGFTDNGSNYTKSEQVKDNPPSGYTDNGSEYIATAGKEAIVVPA